MMASTSYVLYPAQIHPAYELAEELKLAGGDMLTLGNIILNASGTVYSINAGKQTSPKSNTPRVKVIVTKTGGKAKTEVTISTVSDTSVGLPLTTVKKRYTFENGNYTRTKTFTLYKVKGKQIQVRLDNKSFSNKFEYTVCIEEI